MKFSTTLFNTLQKAKLVTVAGYATESFEFDRVTNTVELALANEEDVTFLDQPVVIDEHGTFTAMNSEGVHNAFKAEMTRPFTPTDARDDAQCATPHCGAAMPLSIGKSSGGEYSVDGENWLNLPDEIRFNFKAVSKNETESQDLHLTVTYEGVIADLVGEYSGDFHSTVFIDIAAIAELLIPESKAPAIDYWNDNAVQFPRLLTEINATQDSLDVIAIAQAMDLTEADINELFDRADKAWDNHKERDL